MPRLREVDTTMDEDYDGAQGETLAHDNRFWSKVETTGFCWNWTGYKNPKGYGGLERKGRSLKAHRRAYELLVGPIPEGLQIDHLCRNTSCVNPDHLQAVTALENSRRKPAESNALKTHCPKGHAYSGENLYARPGGSRGCKECIRTRSREAMRRKRATHVR